MHMLNGNAIIMSSILCLPSTLLSIRINISVSQTFVFYLFHAALQYKKHADTFLQYGWIVERHLKDGE